VRDQTRYEELFDRSTHLPGWALLVDRTHMALARALRLDRSIVVVGLDGPRRVDGQPLDLVEFAYELRSRVRTDDTVARIGPATFVVVCNEVVEVDPDPLLIAARLVLSLGVICRLGAVRGDAGDAPEWLLHQVIDQVIELEVDE
jgi:GGDEF domain-containing protein